MKKMLTLLSICILATACRTYTQPKPIDTSKWSFQPVEKAIDLRAGATEAEVIKALGKPITNEFNAKGSAMQWCHSGEVVDRYVIGFFYNHILVGMRNYVANEGGVVGDCAVHYKNIEWKPSDTVIEYRFR